MKYIYALIVPTLLIVFSNSLIRAEQTNLKIKILPIDCMFEVIDIGTQQLRYLTPETCPIEELPPDPEVITPNPSAASSPITIKRTNYYLDYVDENTTQTTNPSYNQPKVAAATEAKTLFDSITKTNDIIGMAFSFLAITGLFILGFWYSKKLKIDSNREGHNL